MSHILSSFYSNLLIILSFQVYEVRESAVPRFVGRKVKLQKLDKLIKGDTVWTVEGEIVVDQNDRINRCIMSQSGSVRHHSQFVSYLSRPYKFAPVLLSISFDTMNGFETKEKVSRN